MRERVSLRIVGFVQGVFYRHTARQVAESLEVAGIVRNERDGSVTIIVEGEKEALQKFIEWCKKGTGYSRVRQVDAVWEKASGEFHSFEVE